MSDEIKEFIRQQINENQDKSIAQLQKEVAYFREDMQHLKENNERLDKILPTLERMCDIFKTLDSWSKVQKAIVKSGARIVLTLAAFVGACIFLLDYIKGLFKK